MEVYLHSRKNKSNTFSPLQNYFLPPSKKITLKSNHFIFPTKNKDICDYDPRCIYLWFRARIYTLHALCFGLNKYIITCVEVNFFAGFGIYAKN